MGYPSCRYDIGIRRTLRDPTRTVSDGQRDVHKADPAKVVHVVPLSRAIRAVFLSCGRPCRVVLLFASPGTAGASLWPIIQWG